MIARTDPPDLRIWDCGRWRRVYYTKDGRGWIPTRLGRPSDWLVSMRKWHQYCAAWFDNVDKFIGWRTQAELNRGWLNVIDSDTDPELPWEFA